MARILTHFLFILFLAFCTTPRLAFGDSPSEHIQETIQQVLSAMNGSVSDGEAARKQSIRETILPRFDWAEMAKQTLGKHWDAVSARQQEFIAAFVDFLGSTYVGKIGSYKDEKILFVQETVKDNRAQVHTKIVPTKGEPTSVNYQLHLVQGEWKIYDVVVEDISLVGNYRSQFGRILARGSFDDLLRTLTEKQLSQRN
jgi:phospholipid transport system substrate-binding protein